MPFEPAFMSRLPEFEAALAQVRTVQDWLAFKARFFSDQPWPRRTPEALAAGRAEPPVVAGDRVFTRAPLPDDVTPEARYRYFSAIQVGLAATYPADAPSGSVRFHCPACEIWTDTPGDPACPLCARPLLTMRLAPPK